MSTEQFSATDQTESDTLGWGKFLRSLALRGTAVVLLSFALQSDAAEERLIVATCDTGATSTIPLDTLEEFLENGCTAEPNVTPHQIY